METGLSLCRLLSLYGDRPGGGGPAKGEDGRDKTRGHSAAKKTGKQQTWDEEEEVVRKAVRLSAFLLIPNGAQHPSGWPSGQIRSDAFQLTREQGQ